MRVMKESGGWNSMKCDYAGNQRRSRKVLAISSIFFTFCWVVICQRSSLLHPSIVQRRMAYGVELSHPFLPLPTSMLQSSHLVNERVRVLRM